MAEVDARSNIPYLSTDQMIEVDRAMIEDYNILLIQMMENAGRNLAALARSQFLGGDPRGKEVVVLVGKGGNGGGGMVCARRLHNWGATVKVYSTAPAADFVGIPAHQFQVLQRMGVPVMATDEPAADQATDLVVDAVIGYSLKGDPRGRAAATHFVGKQPGCTDFEFGCTVGYRYGQWSHSHAGRPGACNHDPRIT